jgi:hypothetical protein
VGVWLNQNGFSRAGAGHFTQQFGKCVGHVGFQKLRSGRNIRVMCHISMDKPGNETINGPWSDAYERPESPNKKRYQFGWSTREADIAHCASEYCRYINDVVITWLNEQSARTNLA